VRAIGAASLIRAAHLAALLTSLHPIPSTTQGRASSTLPWIAAPRLQARSAPT